MGHLSATPRSTTLEAAAAARTEEPAGAPAPAQLTPGQQAAMARRLAQLNNALGEPDFNLTIAPAASNASEFGTPTPANNTMPANTPSRAKIAAIALLLGTGLALALTQAARAPSLPLADIQSKASAPRGAILAPATPAAPIAVAPPVTESAPNTTAPAPESAPAAAAATPPEDAIRTTLENWRQAWATRDVAGYLAQYGEGFTPADGAKRSDWVAARTKKLSTGAPITLALQGVTLEPMGDTRFKVSFLQDYAAGSYSEIARPKTLEFAQENGEWKIVAERQESAKPAGR